MDAVIENKNKLSNLQLELLKSLKYMASEKQIKEVKSLLRFYFAQQLDLSIEKAESEKDFTAEIYESWLDKYDQNI
jgi:hypothetical protein